MFFPPQIELTVAARKSQIAIEYSYRQRERSPQISTFWIHASSKVRFEQSYSEIAMAAEIPGPGTGDGKVDILQLVSKWLKNRDNGPWLLILDNADDATILLDLSKDDTKTRATTVACRLLDYLPRVQHGAVLITTRDRTCALDLAGHYGTPIEVRSMSSKESVQLLQNTLPDAIEEEASELVEELDNVPLAVSQASAYIKAISQVSIPIYLATFRRSNEDQAALLNKNKKDLRRDPGVPNAVITSWELSFKQIREKFPSSADLLSLMSYFNRQAIPQMLIQGDDDDLSFYEDINPLISFSLIRAEIGDNSFEMHRLVQTAMRYWLRSEGYEQLWKERAIERVALRFPPINNQTQRWPVCEALMSHADEIILHTANSKESELNLANVLVFTAWYSVERKGNGELAEQRSTHALQIQRQYFDDDSDEILGTLNSLAGACVELSKHEKARSLRESILKQSLKMWGPEDVKTLTLTHNLAISYMDLGLYEKAEDLMQRVIKGWEKLLGPEDPQTLRSRSESAEIQLRQGKYEEAEMLISKILEISKRRHGVEHIDTLVAMTTLSDTYMQQNKLEEAENVITQAIPIVTKTFGPDHWRTLEARCRLATIYWSQKKLDEAEEIFLSCFDTAQRIYGPQHRIKLQIINDLALVYKNQGNFTDASRLLKDNVESYKKEFGADHPHTLTGMSNLASCYYDMGDKEDAVQLMTEVLCKRREVLHADHPYAADTAKFLARWKSLEGESEEEGREEDGSEEEGSEEKGNEEKGSEEEGNEEDGTKEWETEKEGREEDGSEEDVTKEDVTKEDGSGGKEIEQHKTLREQFVRVQISSTATQ